MNKCRWCEHSYNDNGQIKCPYWRCQLSQKEIVEILKILFKGDKQ